MSVNYSKDIRELVFDSVENEVDGLVVADIEGKILYANKAYRLLTNLGSGCVGRNLQEYIDAGVIKSSTILKVIRFGKALTEIHSGENGAEIITVAKPVFADDGKLRYVVANIRNISDYVNLSSDLKKLDTYLNTYRELSFYHGTSSEPGEGDVVAVDPASIEAFKTAERVAKADASVLILGESGVGKDIMARFIHDHSRRREKTFTAVNCGAIPEELMESELFGYMPGSFTGGLKGGKKGILACTDGGTLFLDEVGEMPKAMQVKFLRVLENHEFTPIGSTEAIPVDIRVIAATNQNITDQVRAKNFREDLYYRLNVITINILPLRERKNDIAPLALYFLRRFNEKYDVSKKISTDLMFQLHKYDWPGNVRELRNAMERAVVMSPGEYLQMQAPRDSMEKADPAAADKGEAGNKIEIEHEDMSLKEYMDRVEKEFLQKSREKYGSTRKMSQILKVDHSTIVRKLKKYKIN